MTIEDKRICENIAFVEVEIGKCFVYDGNYFIKIEYSTLKDNAFCLNKNEKESFNGSDMVTLVNAKVVIE